MTRFRVKELAQERGIAQEELAYKSGVKISTLRNVWQNRVSDPASSTLFAIARVLGVPVEDLVVQDELNQAGYNGEHSINKHTPVLATA